MNIRLSNESINKNRVIDNSVTRISVKSILGNIEFEEYSCSPLSL